MGDPKIYEIGPKYVAENYAWSAAGWYWHMKGINNAIANGASVRQVTQLVNGGYAALEKRQAAYDRFYGILGG